MLGTAALRHHPENANLQLPWQILCLSVCACVYIDNLWKEDEQEMGKCVISSYHSSKFIIMPKPLPSNRITVGIVCFYFSNILFVYLCWVSVVAYESL